MYRINQRLYTLLLSRRLFLIDINISFRAFSTNDNIQNKCFMDHIKGDHDFEPTSSSETSSSKDNNRRQYTLTIHDKKLINHDDFNDIKLTNDENKTVLLPEDVIEKMKEMIDNNLENEESDSIYRRFPVVYGTSGFLLADDVFVNYLCSQSEHGPKFVASLAVEMSKYFPVQSKRISRKRYNKMKLALIQLFTNALEHKNSNFADVSLLCDKLIQLGLMQNRDIFLETATEYKLKNGKFDDYFFVWSSYCLSEHTVAGGQSFFIHALADTKTSKSKRQKRILNILNVYEKVRHPADGLAQLIISMVLTNNYDDARILWKKLSIDCIHFVRPVRSISAEEDLVDVNAIHVRQIADLISECVIAETKKRPQKMKTVSADVEQTNPENNEDNVEENKINTLAEKQIEDRGNVGFLMNRWKVFHKRRFVKSKSKKYAVKPDQLERLLNTLEDVWIKIAESSQPGNRKSILDNMMEFMASNNLVLEDKNEKKVNRLYTIEKLLSREHDNVDTDVEDR